ncbi:flagellar biosynthesis anti-sigma factor FlgM [bacterium]|nr:flagellar biosynthesis anti-sigma factor FlgM [bacterium]
MSSGHESEAPPRKRSLTSLTLAWLSDKLRRAEEVKEQVRSGAYEVDTEKLAASMVNKES